MAAAAQDCDLVTNDGRVMDPETMFDSIANVGIKTQAPPSPGRPVAAELGPR